MEDVNMEGKKLPKLVIYSYGTADFTFKLMMMLSVTYYAIFYQMSP